MSRSEAAKEANKHMNAELTKIADAVSTRPTTVACPACWESRIKHNKETAALHGQNYEARQALAKSRAYLVVVSLVTAGLCVVLGAVW